MTPAPRVFLIDDQSSIRKALTRLLASADFDVVAFDSAQAFLDSGNLTAPGCIVLDLAMPGMDGLALQQAITAQHSELAVIFLTGHGDIATGVQAMKRGAIDFLTKPVDDALLLLAVCTALEKNRQTRAAREASDVIRCRLATLTPRECEVLTLVVTGYLNKQIAVVLGTVEKTIKAHRARVMAKMQAGSLAELVRLAGQVGIGGNNTR